MKKSSREVQESDTGSEGVRIIRVHYGQDNPNPLRNEIAFYALKRLQTRKRKVVDRRASKSRKIRYNVHEKIVNFMAPQPMISGIVKGKELYDKVEDGNEEQNEKTCKVAKGPLSSKKDEKLLDKGGETEQDEVYQISSGDEDCSRGMKKWTMGYYQSRPGLKILQQRIDDFITDHEEEQEKARKEREELAAEGGWTVVSHHKGRKKMADSESGITVGSVAPAAVLDKMAKKKTKEVGVEFYRFQKRDAQRNEIMMLQSKFEQDKKRIQQMRAARKFRPYLMLSRLNYPICCYLSCYRLESKTAQCNYNLGSFFTLCEEMRKI